jgi:hypothetical protein
MGLVSEAHAAGPLDSRPGGDPASAPPGAFTGEVGLADTWSGILERLSEVMLIELDRARGRVRSGNWSRQHQDERIRTLWAGRSARWVAFVEDIPEADVQRIRKRGREVLT